MSEEEKEIKKSKFERLLFEKGMTLKEVHNETHVAYPTLINLKKGRRLNYRKRTLIDVALYMNVPVSDLLEDDDEQQTFNTPFEKAMTEKGVTMQDIHESTGVSYPTLMDFKRGKKKNYRKRTILDISEYLGLTEDQLINPSESSPKA